MRAIRTAFCLLILGLWAPFAGAQEVVGEHLPKAAKAPAAGQLPDGLRPYGARAGGRMDPGFDRLVDDALAALLAFDPVQATELGFHQYDALLPDADSTALRKRVDALRFLDRRLMAFGQTSIDSIRQIDHARLRSAIVAAFPSQRDPVYYVDVAARGIRSLLKPFAPVEERASNVIARVNAIGPFLRSGRANLAEVGMARADVQEAIARSKKLVAFLSNALPVAMKDVKDTELREELDHHLAQAAGAAADYHDWLVNEVLPTADGAPVTRARPDNALARLVRR